MYDVCIISYHHQPTRVLNAAHVNVSGHWARPRLCGLKAAEELRCWDPNHNLQQAAV
jgi:hypothetical protein